MSSTSLCACLLALLWLGDNSTAQGAHPAPSVDTEGMRRPVREALEQARAAVAAAPTKAEPWARLGALFDAHRFYEAAAECYGEAHGRDPREFSYVYLQAFVADLAGAEAELTLALFDKAAGLAPDYLPVWLNLGHVQARSGRTVAAIASYDAALARDAKYAAAHLGRGQVLLVLDRAEEACKALERAAELVPDDRAINAALARTYRRLGRLDEARLAATRMRHQTRLVEERDEVRADVERLGISSYTAYNRGRELFKTGDYAAAVLDFERFLERRPESPAVQVLLARSYFGLGKRRRARKLLEQLIVVEPGRAEAHRELARVCLAGRAAQPETALEHAQRALELDTRDHEARVLMARALLRLERYEEALKAFGRLPREHPLSPGDRLSWADAQVAVGRLEDAVLSYRRLLSRQRTLAPAHFNLGVCLERLERWAEALEAFQTAARLDPSLPTAARVAAVRAHLR